MVVVAAIVVVGAMLVVVVVVRGGFFFGTVVVVLRPDFLPGWVTSMVGTEVVVTGVLTVVVVATVVVVVSVVAALFWEFFCTDTEVMLVEDVATVFVAGLGVRTTTLASEEPSVPIATVPIGIPFDPLTATSMALSATAETMSD